MIIQPMRVVRGMQGNRVYLNFSLTRSQSGSVQPKDMENVGRIFNMPWIPDTLFALEPERNIIMTAFGELHLF